MLTRPGLARSRCARTAWGRSIALCAAMGLCGLACGSDAVPEDLAPEPNPEPEPEPVPACVTVAAGGPAWSQTFPEQAGRFHAELEVTPSAGSIEAVVGLGAGAGADGLAAIVRFGSAGTIDVRAGSTYRADVVERYEAGTRYHVRIDVDVRAQTYSVWLRDGFGYRPVAQDYPFATEQAAAVRLDAAASRVDSAAGTLEVCGLQVVADPTTADGCFIASAGDGLATVPLADATALATLTLGATPSEPGIDAVIGVSAGPPATVGELAAAVRFAPTSQIEVLDGERFRAELVLPYAMRLFELRWIADLTTHTYSVFHPAGELARQFRFAPAQGAVAHLDRLSAIVESARGRIKICHARSAPSVGVVYSREGRHAVVPLAGDQALVSDGATTSRLDAGGRVVAQVARGGELAVGAGGQVFVASAAGSTLTVDKLEPSLAPQWQTTQAIVAGAAIQAMGTDGSGALWVALVPPFERQLTVLRFAADGALIAQRSLPGDAVVFDGDQLVVAWSAEGALRITRVGPTGALVWERAFAGRASVTAMAIAPDHGVLFGGALAAAMDFGGGVLPTSRTETGPVDGYVVKLSAGGDHVFSRKTGYSLVGGLASNGERIVVSSTERTQLRYLRFQELDASGALITRAFDTGFGEPGVAGRVAIGASGRVWWNLDTEWPVSRPWPYLVVIRP